MLVGIGTVLADDPMLVTRKERIKNPLRVIIDPQLKIPVSSQLTTTVNKAPTLVLTHISASSKKALLLKKHGVQIASFPKKTGGIPFKTILTKLGQMGVTSLLIEGGGKTNGRAIREGVVDKMIFFIAPKLLCGNDAKAVVDGVAIASLADAVALRDITMRKIGDDLCVEGYIT